MPIKEVVPQPMHLQRTSLWSIPMHHSRVGDGYCSIKHKMLYPTCSLLFVQLGVYLGGVAGLSGTPMPGPLPATAEGEEGALRSQRDVRPKATELCQSHHRYGKSTLLYT